MKNVFITGGSKGIGAATVERFASSGWNVYSTYLNSESSAKILKDKLESTYDTNVTFYKMDVSIESDILRVYEDLVNKEIKLDAIVNNAGIAIDTTFDDKTKENFNKILDVNLVGPFLVSKYFSSLMTNGTIVNVASTNGIDSTYVESLDYDASKAGLINLTKNLAHNYAPRIRVNAVAPGWVVTPMNESLDKDFRDKEIKKTLLERFADPSEIASVIYFLSTEESSFIDGEVIKIDGGYNV